MKAQSSTEFVLLIGFVLLMLAVLLVVIESRMYSSILQDQDERAAQIERIILNEAVLAQRSSDGYQRTFFLPQSIQGQEYVIERIDDRELVISYAKTERLVFLPKNVTLINITRGYNIISKGSGMIFIEDASSIGCLDVDGDLYNGSGITCDPISPFFDCMELDASGVSAVDVNKGTTEDSAAKCTNNVDDDCDFYVDCNDQDCREQEQCKITSSISYFVSSSTCASEGTCTQVHQSSSRVILDSTRTVGSFVTPLLDANNITKWQYLRWTTNYELPGTVLPSTGMIAYYSFNTTPSVRDDSNHGLDLTTNAGALYLPSGIAGGSYDFISPQGFVSTPVSSIVPKSNFTVEALVFYRGSIPSEVFGYAGIFRMHSSWRLMVQEPNPPFAPPVLFYQYLNASGTSPFATSDHALVRNQWNHIALTVTNETAQVIRFYVNGQESVKSDMYSPIPANDIIIVGGGQSNSYTLNGTIDEMSVWNRSLSAAEIRDHASAYTSVLRFQVCPAVLPSDCQFNNQFLGPDGTFSTYYEGTESTRFDISHLQASRYLKVRFLFLNQFGVGSSELYSFNVTGLIVG